jgi:Phospholipase_D-nuclease N-terminal
VLRYLPFLISLALTIYALFSCVQTRDEDVPYLPKLVWVVIIVLVPFAGAIIWLVMSRRAPAGGQSSRGAASRGPAPSGPQPRTTGPDDDPEFLAWLDRQQRRNKPPRRDDNTDAKGNEKKKPQDDPRPDKDTDAAGNEPEPRSPDEPA